MASIRALMKTTTDTQAAASTVTWVIDWLCVPIAGTGSYPATTTTITNLGDTAAIIQGKIIDSLVTWAGTQGHTLNRTDVYLLQYTRGS